MRQYVCDCGRVFDKPNSFNGHKSHCKVHLEKTGRLHVRNKVDSEIGLKSGQTLKSRHRKLTEIKLNQWVEEQHICETCGKIMSTKWGSGRFCSKSCANTRSHSQITKDKIKKNSLDGAKCGAISKHNKALDKYYSSPNICNVCKSIIPYEFRYRKTCSDNCFRVLMSTYSKESVITHGGNINQIGFKSHIQGNYKGFHCDSTWELAFIVYHLEHNILFERNKEYFPYLYEGKEHNYFPDFKIGNEYIEVKGYVDEVVKAKIEQFPKDKKLVMLQYNEMKPMIDYCIEKYGNNYWEALYE